MLQAQYCAQQCFQEVWGCGKDGTGVMAKISPAKQILKPPIPLSWKNGAIPARKPCWELFPLEGKIPGWGWGRKKCV